MRRFNTKGMWHIPKTGKKKKKQPKLSEEDLIVVEECYCPNGHMLINPEVEFGGHHGILIKVKKGHESGFIALSPICGDKSRFSFDVELIEGELLEMSCLECGASFPVYGPCDCGGEYITLVLTKGLDFTSCIGICTRVGCNNSWIKHGDEIRRYYLREKL